MRFMSVLVLLTGQALVSPGGPTKPEPAELTVPVVKAAVGGLVFKQIKSARPPGVTVLPSPVFTLENGLSHVRKFSKEPIIAMSESQGWFFYATTAARDENGRPEMFISGCAIQRGGRQLIRWSVW